MHRSRRILLGILSVLMVATVSMALAAGNGSFDWNAYIKGIDPVAPPSGPVPGLHAVGPSDPGSAVQSAPSQSAASAQPLRFVRWRDPQEGSFNLDVPAGWRVQGGVAWNSIQVAREWVRARNPSNTAVVFIGDPAMLPRIVPNPAYARAGYASGSTITTEAGARALLQPYMTGEQYAVFHAHTICRNPGNAGMFRLQQETAAYMQAMRPFQAYMKVLVTVGEAYVNCGGSKGYVHAVTLLAGQNGPGVDTWDIFAVGGFSAGDPADYELARQALLRMEATYQENPQWRAGVDQRLNIANTALARANEAMENMMLESGRRDLDAHTRIANKWSDIILGQEHRCTATGECRETSNACDHVWKNGDGWFCGPSDGSPPPPGDGPWVPTQITPP